MSRSLFRSTFLVSLMTSLSRVLGFVRDMVFAWLFGSDAQTDAFFVAFRIPNLFRRLFAEGAFSLAFVPVLSEYKTERSPAELKALIDRVVGTLGLILFVITALGVVSAAGLIWLFAPGFSGDEGKLPLAGELLRLTFPYLFFISLTACAGSILNCFDQFVVPAFTPCLLNLSLIAAAIWLAPLLEQPILALGWGVLIAGVLQLGFQLPFLARLGLLPRPRWGWQSAGVQRILALMVPALFGSSVAQVNLLINTWLASFLISGSVSWLYFTDRLVEFPLGVFAVALATVILPKLSRHHAADEPERFSSTLDWAMQLAVVIGIPATVALMLLATPLLSTFFQYGAFSANDVQMTSRSLIAYTVGLQAFMLIKVLAPGFYARQDTRTPVRIGIIAMIANIGFNLIFISFLAHAGLALATALAGCLNAGLLFYTLYRQGIIILSETWRLLLLRTLIASTIMGVVLWFGSGTHTSWLAASASDRVWHLIVLIIAGSGCYALVLLALGLRPRHLGLS